MKYSMRNASLILSPLIIFGTYILTTSCSKVVNSESTGSKFLYVASGLCYSGGNTTFSNTTSSNLIYRINLDTGLKDMTIADYTSSPAQAGDSPVGITNVDSNNIYVLVENTTTVGARRIEKVPKASFGSRSLFSNNITALNAILRTFRSLPNGDFLISKSSAIEKITTANVRITQGANPYINNPAAPCSASTTLISKLEVLNNQFIVFLHAAPGQNRFGFVKPAGYAAAGDCTPAQSAPNASSFPVAAAYDSVHSKLIVAYAGNTTATDINSIYVYDITETTSSVTVGTANKIYDANLYSTTYPYLLYGISAMVFDPETSYLYIATAINTTTTISNYAIEKFYYDSSKLGTANSSVLTRVGTTPFYSYGTDTKCISDMMLAD